MFKKLIPLRKVLYAVALRIRSAFGPVYVLCVYACTWVVAHTCI